MPHTKEKDTRSTAHSSSAVPATTIRKTTAAISDTPTATSSSTESSSFTSNLAVALALNISLKLVTFVLNTALTRLLLPAQAGVGFYYTLYMDSVLFLAREAVQGAAARVDVFRTSAPNEERARGEAPHHTTDDKEKGGKREEDEAPPGGRVVSGAAALSVLRLGALSLPLALAAMTLVETAAALLGSRLPLPSLWRHYRQSARVPVYADTIEEVIASDSTAPLLLVLRWCAASAPALPEATVAASVVLLAMTEPLALLASALELLRVAVVAEFASLAARLLACILLVRLLLLPSTGAAAASSAAASTATSPSTATTAEAVDGWLTRMMFAGGQLVYAVAYAACHYGACGGGVGRSYRGGRRHRWVRRLLGGADVAAEARAAVEAAEAAEAGELEKTGSHGRLPATALACYPWGLMLRSPGAARREWGRRATLLAALLRESVLRVVLTEGEGFALAALGSAAARGYQSTLGGLGALVARLVFRVWERACGARWAREAAGGRRARAAALLRLMLRVALYFGAAFALAGPPLAGRFLRRLYAGGWAAPAAVAALQWYCYSIPCMAVNGLMEAYLRATAGPAALAAHQRAAVATTLVYVALCYVVVGRAGGGAENFAGGAPGDRPSAADAEAAEAARVVASLVVLNIANMLWRSAVALRLCTDPRYRQAAAPITTTATSATDAKAAEEPQHLLWPSPRDADGGAGERWQLRAAALVCAVTVIFAASRLVPVFSRSVPALALLCACYVLAILGFDTGVRRLALRAVPGRLRAKLKVD